MDMQKIAENYIAVWNEKDESRRKALIADTFTSGSIYVDPLAAVKGQDGIQALVSGVHAQFPGFRFSLDGAVDGYGDRMRFSWTLGPEGIEAPIRGTDFAQIEDGRLSSVIGFLDRVPEAA